MTHPQKYAKWKDHSLIDSKVVLPVCEGGMQIFSRTRVYIHDYGRNFVEKTYPQLRYKKATGSHTTALLLYKLKIDNGTMQKR